MTTGAEVQNGIGIMKMIKPEKSNFTDVQMVLYFKQKMCHSVNALFQSLS